MSKKAKNAISPTREENYPEWYQQIIRAADLAENSPVRGCMVIKPWGYGIWENVQHELDKRIKATGHENAYFPLFIPLSFLEKEAEHVEGFAKECAVVTHHRLEERDGKLVPTGELEEPLVVRPTSETIIGESFSKWVQSYRDLPLLINQWANVVRWEMRPRVFLRTAEFLWQEGHTVHATEAEAREEVMLLLNLYREVAEEVLAVPVIAGEKTPQERFPGAVQTVCIEAMMQDRKALQMGTSHYLGQNFAKAASIRFLNENSELEYAHTTSWGVSTRLIGGLIMTHSDDDGLRIPPRVAPKHVVILPVVPKEELRASVCEYAEQIAERLRGLSFFGRDVQVSVDKRDIRGGEKTWQWVKKGVPVRLEVGPRDMESSSAMLYRRDKGAKDKESVSIDNVAETVLGCLDEIQKNYFAEAKARLDEHLTSDISSYEELAEFFTPKNQNEIHGGFVRAKWCEEEEIEAKLAELKLSIRCIPEEQSGSNGTCIVSGKPAKTDVIIAKAY